MNDKTKLNILWTNDNLITSEKMVFMYAINAKRKEWWDDVTIIIWGAPAKLVSNDKKIQDLINEAQSEGVHITACKACTDQLGVTKILEGLNIEIKYWGETLTQILKSEEKLITI
ncbi:DsrE family protein [Desulfobacter sp.]|uniref:DsrE family protein n=1 Tax=Desulfobacter sp. TaxID=2294 RepID=UPI003D0A2F5A